MTTSLVSLIEQYTPLQKAGPRYYRGIEHDSLIVDTHKDRWHWNSAGESGDAAAWLMKREGLTYPEALERLGQQSHYTTPLPTAPAPDLSAQLAALPSRAEYYFCLGDLARDYWRAAGLTDETITRFRLGYAHKCPTAAGPSYVIPYIEAGEVVSIRHRLLDESRGRYRPEFSGLGNRLFNPDSLQTESRLSRTREAVIVEGEKKAMVLDQAGFRVTGLPGANTWRPDWLSYFDKIDLVYIAADPGAFEQMAAVARDFEAAGKWAKVAELPGKPDDLLSAGMTPAALQALLEAGQDFVHPKAQARIERRRAALARLESRRRELAERLQPGYRRDAIPWDISTAEDYKTLVAAARQNFTNAREWREYVDSFFPELDPGRELQLKLDENREQRMATCGRTFRRLSATGEIVTKHITCGYCKKCLARDRENLKRALEEAMLADDNPDMALTLITAYSKDERRIFTRRLRTAETPWKCFPVKGGEYHILIKGAQPDQGEILDPIDLTQARLEAWQETPAGERTSGNLFPSIRALQAHYREREKYEYDGEPWTVDPETGARMLNEDVIELHLPGIITEAEMPAVTVEEDVTDAKTLQQAIFDLHERAVKVLAARGHVIYGVTDRKFYTHKMTLPQLMSEFNQANRARLDRLREKRRE